MKAPKKEAEKTAKSSRQHRPRLFARTELARFQPKRRERDPLEVLATALAGRLPALTPLKQERMRASAFGFFRGAVPVMAYDLSLAAHSGVVTQLCGDAHVQNLGAYLGADGRLIFDINDFDETIRGPFEWDLKRMATSILLAGREAGIKESACRRAAQLCLRTYCDLLQQFARMPVLQVARYQVHRLASVAPIGKILSKAERATPLLSLESLTVPAEGKAGRIFRNEPPLLQRVTGAEANAVLGCLPLYQQSLLPERQHFFAKFRPVDVAFKVVGTGSIGLRDYCVYLEGNGPEDPLFLQIKEEALSAYAPYLPEVSRAADNQGRRAAEGQRAMQLESDPLLGWTTLDGRSYLVRQLKDHKASVDITRLHAKDLREYATVCGQMLARGHARSGDARGIAGYLDGGKWLISAVLDFAGAYARQTERDWKQLAAVVAERKSSDRPSLALPSGNQPHSA